MPRQRRIIVHRHTLYAVVGSCPRLARGLLSTRRLVVARLFRILRRFVLARRLGILRFIIPRSLGVLLRCAYWAGGSGA
jgi:hypothetical protein